MAKVAATADQALIIAVPEDAHMTESLAAVYEGLPPKTIRACETRRMAIQYGSTANLMQVRDILEPLGRFQAWCEASGFVYLTVVAAIRRLEVRLLANGHSTTPSGRSIKPYIERPSRWDVSWGLRNTLRSARFDELFNGKFLRWMQRQPRMAEDGTLIRDRCMRLASLLLEAARTEFVDAAIEAEVVGQSSQSDSERVSSKR